MSIWLVALMMLTAAAGQAGQRDAAFSQVPFEEWRTGGKPSTVRWSAEVVPAELSGFQRMIAGVKVQADGKELRNHHALVLVELQDAEGDVWQTHGEFGRQPDFQQKAFVLPGDYAVSAALYDPVTGKHGFARKKLHVEPLKHDPLPGAWEGLPRVEFLPAGGEAPDAWYLPAITGRLRLPVATEHRVHIDMLVNTTASEKVSDSLGEMRRNMSAVIPALKTITQMELSNGAMDVAFLDLTRRRSAGISTWDDMKRFFAQINPGIIDVHALDSRWKMLSFFADQFTASLSGQRAGEARVVIVLSGPAFFAEQEPVAKIDLPADPARRVFYIRCRLIPHSVLEPRPRPRPGARPRLPMAGTFRLPLDDLEKPLDGSGAMLFDVITPEQFRRVLAAVIGQISRL